MSRGPSPLPAAAPPAGGRRRRYERKRALIDVQTGALRALEQHAPAGVQRVVQHTRHVGHEGPDPLDCRVERLADLNRVDRIHTEPSGENEIVVLVERPKLRVQSHGIEKIADAHRPSRGLVFIRGADPASRRSNRDGAACRLARAVQHCVVGEDERARIAHPHPLRHRNATAGEHAHLVDERGRRQHHTVPDHALHPLPHHTGGNEVEDGAFAADN